MKPSKTIGCLCLLILPLWSLAQIQIPHWTSGDHIGLTYNIATVGSDFGLSYAHRFGSNVVVEGGVHLMTTNKNLLFSSYTNFQTPRFKNRLGWHLAFMVLKPLRGGKVEIGPLFRVQYFRLSEPDLFFFRARGPEEVFTNKRTFEGVFGCAAKFQLSDSPVFFNLAAGFGLLAYEGNAGFFSTTRRRDPEYYSTDFGSLLQFGLSYRL